MKKVYVKPQMDIVEVETESLLVVSGYDVIDYEGSAVGAPRKRRSGWGYEDDDFME